MLSCYTHALDIVLVHFCATRTYLNISPPPYIYLASYKYVLDTSPLTTYIPHIFNITSNVALASLHISSMTVLRVAPACRYESCLTSGTQKMSTCRAYTNELRSRSRNSLRGGANHKRTTLATIKNRALFFADWAQ